MDNKIPDWATPTAMAILETVKAKDPHTFFHCCRVGRAARLLGRVLGFDSYNQMVLEFSGMLHDVGKVGIPDDILFKSSALSEDEFHMMRLHPLKSAQIIRPLVHNSFFKDVLPGVELHHERPDGLGYPYKLSGSEISEMVRIVTLVDAVDAMMSARPYRKAMSFQFVKSELKKHAGTQFDANMVKEFLKLKSHWDEELDSISKGDQIADTLIKEAS